MIYFIKNVANGNIKIGFSETPTKRLRELQTGSTERLVLLKSIPGDHSLERQLHEQFAHCRLDGEWFSSADEILEFIRGQDRRALVGKFFHTFKNSELEWQGYVVSEPSEGYFLVQLFEWIMGEPSCQKLVRIDDMVGWDLYDTVDDMNDAYQRKWAKR
jgi:hypothetical protein